jgi:AcrR family transcriptional regulator
MTGVAGQVKRRRYDTSGRRAASDSTRRRILAAAHGLILQKGYRATTVAAIAAAADVNVDTVYELVGRKHSILEQLVEQAISGSDRAVEAEDRDYVRAIRAEPDAVAKLRIYAAAVTRIQARLAPLFVALRDAAATEPEARLVWQAISERRAANMHKFVLDLRATGRLRAGLSVGEAADTVWLTNSAEIYTMLTVERRWTPRRYERWLAETWSRLLLEPRRSPQSVRRREGS